ncbi:MAG: hypothetical protein Q9169_002120 [Polycauliona sp. 2 TL-2023]
MSDVKATVLDRFVIRYSDGLRRGVNPHPGGSLMAKTRAKTRASTAAIPKPTSPNMESPTPEPRSSAETSRSKSQASNDKFNDADMEISSKIAYKSKPTRLVSRPSETWHVPILSMTSKCFRWSEEDYEFGLDFGFEIQFSSFCLSSNRREVYTLDGSHGGIPFVAIATIGDRPRIRLIPVTQGYNLQSEVFDIELDGAGNGEQMVGYLVGMGCTVVQRPEG